MDDQFEEVVNEVLEASVEDSYEDVQFEEEVINEVLEASVEDSDEDVQREHEEGMGVVVYDVEV